MPSGPTAEFADGGEGRRLIMAGLSAKDKCAGLRRRLAEAFDDRMEGLSAWARRHAAECPRCRRALVGYGRLRLGMMMLKTQPHAPDLLMRANRRAIAGMKHTLRERPEAHRLRRMRPRRTLRERTGRYALSVSHAAACLLVLILLRAGIMGSMDAFQSKGRQAMHDYYARNLDAETLDQLL